MVKEIVIGGKAERFEASGALPVLYRNLVGRDFFTDLQGMGDGALSSAILDMAWVMYKAANEDAPEDEVRWLAQYDFADINNAIPEIIDLLASSQKTTSEPKKKDGQ